MALILDDDSLLDAPDGFAGWDDALEDAEEYAALLGEKGKDAVIRRENKTKRRKKKAALDGGKGSE